MIDFTPDATYSSDVSAPSLQGPAASGLTPRDGTSHCKGRAGYAQRLHAILTQELRSPQRLWQRYYRKIRFLLGLALSLWQEESITSTSAAYWREQALRTIMFIFLLVGAVILVPSALATFNSSSRYVLIVELEVLVYTILLFGIRRVSYSLRSSGFLLLFYFLGTVLVFFFNQWEAGLLCMFAFPVMAAILQGFSSALVALCLNAITLLSSVVLLTEAFHGDSFLTAHFAQNGMVAGINFLSLNLFLTLSVSLIVSGVEKSLRKEKRARKAKLEETEKLKKANAELDRFVYSASHDLKAPLSSLQGLLNLAELETDPAQKDLLLEKMRGRVDKLDTFIRQITEYSWNSRIEVTREPIHFQSLLESVLVNQQYHPGFEQTKVEVNVTGEAVFCSDPSRLQLIFNNLLANCFVFRNPYAFSRVAVLVHPAPGQVRVKVQDNGLGIEPDHLPHVTRMFYRASDRSIGSGLGLFIVAETVRVLKGTLTIASTPGKGTTVEIALPTLQ